MIFDETPLSFKDFNLKGFENRLPPGNTDWDIKYVAA